MSRHPNLKATIALLVLLPLMSFAGAGCSTIPKTATERAELVDDAKASLRTMLGRDEDLQPFLDRSAGYAVFPNCGKGGFLIGGAFGRGAVFAHDGSIIGYAKVSQASVGGVVGGRAFALLLAFENASDLQKFRDGNNLHFGAEATAIALTEGCSATTRFENGVAVFAMPKGGLMADASLNGQVFAFERGPTDAEHNSTASAAVPKE
jgi:lipid-binding SYLF domain-containing protein